MTQDHQLNRQPEDDAVVVALLPADGCVTLAARAPDGGLRAWKLIPEAQGSRANQPLRELLRFVADRPMVSFDAETLAELLSRHEILPLARRALGRLRDLRQMALIWLPDDGGSGSHSAWPAPSRDLLSAIPHAGEGDLPTPHGETVQEPGRPAPRPAEEEGCGDAACEGANTTDLLPQIARALDVWHRVRQAAQHASPDLLAILRPLLADDPLASWVPWPEGPAQPADLLRLTGLLRARPPTRRRETNLGGLSGDLSQLARDLLSPGGLVARAHPAYEHREGQVEMAGEVAEALREERILLVEAGTGVGKSLAYLVPAILWACWSGEPVVVSTNTRNLQDQLIRKDLPLLRAALPVPFEAALVKGRGNYPCVRALLAAAVDAAHSLLRGERLAAAYLVSWLAHSATADLEEIRPRALEVFPELSDLISRVRSQGEACLGRACSHNEVCPVEVTRAHARRADVIISNHALTLADTQATVLPEYSRLIVDEAQNLETVATEALSLECSSYGFAQLTRAISGGPGSFVGIIGRRLERLGDGPDLVAARTALQQIPDLVDEFRQAVTEMGDLVYELCLAQTSGRGGGTEHATVRLTEAVRATAQWEEVVGRGATALEAGRALHTGLQGLTTALRVLDKGTATGIEGLDADAQSVSARVLDSLEAVAAVLEPSIHSAHVTWAEAWRSRWGPAWSLHAAPVDIGPLLSEVLYRRKQGIVMTSATITVEGEFSYFRQRLGLDEQRERLVERQVPSPFSLTDQLLLCVPSDMPDPGSPEFNQAITDALRAICQVSRGGTLALFTARSRLEQAYRALRPELEAAGLVPLSQDVSGPRSQLLERLREDPRTVLFGLKSFWEGVDVPGDALRCVVITKLPFAVPDDPIVEARQEDVARRGLDPMRDYYIPEAIVGFKQGFGRLIRSRTDSGVVFVLDRRILTKSYGRRFFGSIQRCALTRAPLAECLERTRAWLAAACSAGGAGQGEE